VAGWTVRGLAREYVGMADAALGLGILAGRDRELATRREREIAGLVSDGLTNRAIADRLVLSERTVEGHIRSILAKLQLTNRTELAAWMLRDTGS